MKDFLKYLFPSGKKVSVHEPYKPSAKEEEHYRAWIETDRPSELSARIRSAYYQYKYSDDKEPAVQHFQHQSSNCLLIVVGNLLSEYELNPLMRWLAARIQTLNYNIINQDRITRELPGYVQSDTRIYLKPPRSLSVPADQLYGNILLELISEDDRQKYLKMTVTGYFDRSFQLCKPFNELVDYIFD